MWNKKHRNKQNSSTWLTDVAESDMQPAFDNGVDTHGRHGPLPTCMLSCQTGILQVLSANDLQLMNHLHSSATLTQQMLQTQNTRVSIISYFSVFPSLTSAFSFVI